MTIKNSAVDSLAECNDDTLVILRKNIPFVVSFSIPYVPSEVLACMNISGEEVARAIKSFPNGSSGGPDRFCLKHLKDMTELVSGEGGKQLLKFYLHSSTSSWRHSSKFQRGQRMRRKQQTLVYGGVNTESCTARGCKQ